MSYEWFRNLQGDGILKIHINEMDVHAQGHYIGPIIVFPIQWEINPSLKGTGFRWNLQDCTAILKSWINNQILAFSTPSQFENKPSSIQFICERALGEQIEKLRDSGDAKFIIHFTARLSHVADVGIQRTNVGFSNLNQVMVDEIIKEIDLSVNVPKSVYEDKVLPILDIGKLSNVTITIPPGVREILASPLYELDCAQKTLLIAGSEQQYESVIIQCRNALDSLLNQFSFDLETRADGNKNASFPERVDALGVQYLKNTISESQLNAVTEIFKSLWYPFSGSAKPGPACHTKAFATFALFQATSLVRLISDVLWNRTK